MDVRRSESADVRRLVESDATAIRRDDSLIDALRHKLERAGEELAVLDGVLRAVINLVGRSRIRRIEAHAHGARRDASRTEESVRLRARRQHIVPLLDDAARLGELVLDKLAVLRHIACRIPCHIGVGTVRALAEELRLRSVDREVHAVAT